MSSGEDHSKSLTVTGVGTWTVAADGTVTLVPVAGFTGVAPAVPYTVADSAGQRSTTVATIPVTVPVPVTVTVTVTVTVGAVTPIARPDVGSVPGGGTTVSVPLLFTTAPVMSAYRGYPAR